MFYNTGFQRQDQPHDQQSNLKPDTNFQLTQSYQMRDQQESEVLQELTDISQQSLIVKIGKLMHQLITVKQKLFLYEDLSARLRKQNESLNEKMRKLEEQLQMKNKQIEVTNQKLKKLSNEKVQMKKTIDKLQQKLEQKSKEIKVVQNRPKSRNKNKQLMKINEILQKQLSISNSKIIELQRMLQDKSSFQFLNNISRLRQNSMKITYVAPDNHRTILKPAQNNYLDAPFYRTRARSKNQHF